MFKRISQVQKYCEVLIDLKKKQGRGKLSSSEAEAYWQELIDGDPKNPFILQGAAKSDIHYGKYEDALDKLDQVIKISPKNMGAYFYKAEALAYLERLELAEADYEHIIRVCSSFRRRIFSWCVERFAYFYVGMSPSEDSVKGLGPVRARALNGKGWLRRAQGDSVLAHECFKRALDLDINNSAALCGLGELFLEEGLYAEALKYFQEAAEIDSNDPHLQKRIRELSG